MQRFVGELQASKTREDLQRHVGWFRDQLGVDHLVYHSVSGAGEQYGILTYPEEWVQRYIAEGYARIDPVVQGCLRRFQPTDWKHLDWSGRQSRNLLGEAVSAGVGNQGYSVPIRGPGGQFALFTVSGRMTDTRWEKFVANTSTEILLAAHFLNQKAQEIAQSDPLGDAQPLSGREIDVLTLLALGMNRAQAADSLEISEHTFRSYVESARIKLGATNTTHAVARAVSGGFVLL
ncbi:helix-turn-helix transcriptional regulator [Albidovulum sediminicola]|uniref:LuxR family transcriptional regulator n=1 Tax=Albidovulum sediminicola TaxID=2984331 RepID=A0ABT2Z2R9_9RHOB|nr:LuxR family transcriptional regulator [Defluviimonas sp. WL0075]MCV2865312.1 LuxR family transcriptional regulator [Defluviimonas sp. WL0075]